MIATLRSFSLPTLPRVTEAAESCFWFTVVTVALVGGSAMILSALARVTAFQ